MPLLLALCVVWPLEERINFLDVCFHQVLNTFVLLLHLVFPLLLYYAVQGHACPGVHHTRVGSLLDLYLQELIRQLLEALCPMRDLARLVNTLVLISLEPNQVSNTLFGPHGLWQFKHVKIMLDGVPYYYLASQQVVSHFFGFFELNSTA